MELSLVEKVIALEGVDLLGTLDPEHVASIAMIATEAHYPPGSLIIEETKPVEALYVVMDGSAEVTHKGQVLEKVNHGAFLGLWTLMDEDDPIALTVRAVEDIHLLRIGRDEFSDLLADDIEITLALLADLVRRVRKLIAV